MEKNIVCRGCGGKVEKTKDGSYCKECERIVFTEDADSYAEHQKRKCAKCPTCGHISVIPFKDSEEE